MGSRPLISDPNPIVDSGASTSTGGIIDGTHLYDALGIQLNLTPARKLYMHGWGQDCHGAKATVCSWTLTTPEINSLPTSLTFYLVRGSSPLMIGLDVIQHSIQMNTSATESPHISILRPSDNAHRIFNTYIHSEDQGNELTLRQLMRFPSI